MMNETQNSRNEEHCRICYDSSGVLIAPCRCSGGSKYVHVSCLKTWIEFKYSNPENSKCEICQTKFQVSFKVKKKLRCNFSLSRILRRIIPLIVAQGIIALMVYFLVDSYSTSKNKLSTYIIIFLVILCLFTSILSIGIFLFSAKQLSYETIIQDWKIQEWVPMANAIIS